MRIPTTAVTVASCLIAVIATVFAPATGAADRYLPMVTFSVGDRPAELRAGSDVFLTEYRFAAGDHFYALARSLRASVVRELVFIDDRLACVRAQRAADRAEAEDFSTGDDDRRDSVYRWEWANEAAGLEYLAGLLREACGLEPIRERRQLDHEWSNRTLTGAEVARAAGEIGMQLPGALLLGVLSHGYYTAGSEADRRERSMFERHDREDVEQKIWSLRLGSPQEGLAALLGVPDGQFTWSKTGTTVNAYRLGSANHFFVGLVGGRAVWVHSDYPGLILQAKIAAQREVNNAK
jgi:hypothetical protein